MLVVLKYVVICARFALILNIYSITLGLVVIIIMFIGVGVAVPIAITAGDTGGYYSHYYNYYYYYSTCYRSAFILIILIITTILTINIIQPLILTIHATNKLRAIYCGYHRNFINTLFTIIYI